MAIMKKTEKIFVRCLLLLIVLAVLATLIAVLLWNGVIHLNHPSNKKYPIRGVDVSSYQGEIDWKTLSKQDIDFAYIKATEGSTHIDPHFMDNLQNAQKTDLKVGAYHFFSFDSSGNKQAKHFCEVVPAVSEMLPPVVDVEYYGKYSEKSKLSVRKIRLQLHHFIDKIQAYYGKTPIIYATEESYDRFIAGDFEENPLWIRSVYSGVAKDIDWTFWQFSNRHVLSGYKGDERFIDMNVYNGAAEEFRKQFG